MSLKMAVNVTVYVYCSFLLGQRSKIFGREDHRVNPWRGCAPPTIHVKARKTCAVVALNHAVRIQHWHDIDNVVFSDFSCLFAGREQEGDHSFQRE